MPIFKCTLIFNQITASKRVSGWSETWYKESSAGTIVGETDALAKKRTGPLSNGGIIKAFRTQQIGSKGKITITSWPGAAGLDADIPQMAVQCKIDGTGVENRKTFMVRGIPDVAVIDGDFNAGGAVAQAIRTFAKGLSDYQWRFRAIDLTQPKVNILSITAGGVFTLAGALTFDVGDYISVLRGKNTEGKNASGRYYVSAKATALSGTLHGWDRGTIDRKGTMRKEVIIYPIVDLTTYEAIRITTRRVGRPFDLYRGRQTRR